MSRWHAAADREPQLTGRQAVVDPGGSEVGPGGGHPDVGSQGQAQPADGRAVDRRDDRLVQPAHRQDDLVEGLPSTAGP